MMARLCSVWAGFLKYGALLHAGEAVVSGPGDTSISLGQAWVISGAYPSFPD
jgi:hypothetical protein